MCPIRNISHRLLLLLAKTIICDDDNDGKRECGRYESLLSIPPGCQRVHDTIYTNAVTSNLFSGQFTLWQNMENRKREKMASIKREKGIQHTWQRESSFFLSSSVFVTPVYEGKWHVRVCMCLPLYFCLIFVCASSFVFSGLFRLFMLLVRVWDFWKLVRGGEWKSAMKNQPGVRVKTVIMEKSAWNKILGRHSHEHLLYALLRLSVQNVY